MTTSRSRPPEADAENEPVGGGQDDDSPELNVYELNSDRTVLTEPGNTDGWIATDMTVAPWE